MSVDDYANWRSALAGNAPDMHLDEPWCGYFKTRDHKATEKLARGRWPMVACAIWRSEDGTLQAERAGQSSADGAPSMLTPRELAILQLISQAMSNKRVALTLNISLETGKWNLKNIYVKLGVSSRYDAVSWARKHGLIE